MADVEMTHSAHRAPSRLWGAANETARFWSYVRKSEGCWEWTGVLSEGYGTFYPYRQGARRAHRYSYELHFGPIAPGLFVCHRCDNRKCVRPEHIYAGTREDNTRDVIERGRQRTPRRRQAPHQFCRKGHALTPENRRKGRGCRTCYNAWHARYERERYRARKEAGR